MDTLPDRPPAPAALFDLTGQVALVTGASRGLGWGIAQALAAAGATIVLNGRDAATLAPRREALERWGFAAEIAAFDVADGPAAVAAVDAIGARHGRLDILVSNAAANEPQAAAGADGRGLAGRHRRRSHRGLAPCPRGGAHHDPGRLRPHDLHVLHHGLRRAPGRDGLRRGEDRPARPGARARGRAGAERHHRRTRSRPATFSPRATAPCAASDPGFEGRIAGAHAGRPLGRSAGARRRRALSRLAGPPPTRPAAC